MAIRKKRFGTAPRVSKAGAKRVQEVLSEDDRNRMAREANERFLPPRLE